MQCKDADGTLIMLDTSKTEIVMLVNRKQINITINDVIEYNEEKDWILLAVEKPELDEDHIQKIKFADQINIGIECDSYPYLSIMKGSPRYTPLRSLNDMGDFHLIDNASSGRYTADTVMKGGSGSGILRKNEADILCFGLMKETLTDGSLNDIASVDLSEISQILSAEAKKRMTRLEVNQMILDDRNDALNEIKQQISNKQADGTLADFMTHLVYENIPNLLNHYSLDTAWEILQLVIENLPAESDLVAECDYLRAEYYNIKDETDKAREYYNKAFLLCNTEPKYIEHQIKLYQYYEDQASADELLSQLPEYNECRLANGIISSPDVREAFNKTPIEITSLPSFRCRILELSEAKQIDITWLFEDYVPIIPQNLTVQNLREWLFLLSYYRFILRDYIVLNKENSQIPNLETIKEAFSVTKRFFTLAAGTPLEHSIPILRSLYCYWGYILDGNLNWIDEFDKIEFSKTEAQAQFCILLQSSLYSMQHRYVEAYLCISSKHLAYDSSVLHYIIHLSAISGDVSFLKSYLAEHTSEEIVITDYMDNSLAGLLNIMTPEDFKSFVSGLQFLNQNAKQILLDYAKTLNGGSVDVTGYPIVAEGAIGNLASFAARTMASNGKYDAALAYLQPLLRTRQSIVVDATYRDLLSRDKSKADEYYKELHRNRIEGGVVLLNDLTMEYNFSISMSDFANALEVIELMLQEQPDNEMYFSAKVDLLGKVHPQMLPSVYKDAQEWRYVSVQSIITVYRAFAQNGYIQEAIDILYYNCLRLQDEELLSFFDTECVMGVISSIVNQSSEVIEDGSYVIIEHEDGSRDPMKVKVQTILGQALLCHKKDDKIVVSMPDGEKAVVVISILNKYSYLRAMHFKEIFRNGGNGIFKPIHIDTSHPETILQQLNDALGRDTTVDKRRL